MVTVQGRERYDPVTIYRVVSNRTMEKARGWEKKKGKNEGKKKKKKETREKTEVDGRPGCGRGCLWKQTDEETILADRCW